MRISRMSQSAFKQFNKNFSLDERPIKEIIHEPKLDKIMQAQSIQNWQTHPPEIGFIDEPVTKSVGSNTSFEQNSVSDLTDLGTNSSTIRYNDNNKKDPYSNMIHFWDIGGYNVVLDRCDNGYKLSHDLKQLIQERAQLEKDYADSIKKWCKKWRKYLENSSEYGKNMKSGWQAIIDTNEKTSDIHLDLAKKLTEETDSPTKMLHKYTKENYRKRTIKKNSLKKTHEFRVNFVTAQQHWANLQTKLKEQDKEFKKAVKTNRNQEKELKRMNSYRKEIKNYRPIYVENLKNIFEDTQKFELERMHTFVSVFKKYHDVMRIKGDERFDRIFKDLFSLLETLNPKIDLDKWSENYGPGTDLPSTNNV